MLPPYAVCLVYHSGTKLGTCGGRIVEIRVFRWAADYLYSAEIVSLSNLLFSTLNVMSVFLRQL